MSSIAHDMRFSVDLRGGLMEQPQRGKLMCGDKNAAVVIVELYDGDEPFKGDGVTVTGKFTRFGDSVNVMLDGSLESGAATVTLDEHCFAVAGRYELRIKLTKDGITRTVLFISGYVENDGEGGLLDVENVIPSIDDIVAQYAEMKRVTEETQEAADKANDAAEHAPYIDDSSRNWMAWDKDERKYVDTGVPATGPNGDTPHIGSNGNWFVGSSDTGVKAQGPKGADGKMTFTDLTDEQKESLRGPEGKQGPQGPAPERGVDYWTDDDIAKIKAYVDDAILNGAW